MKRIAKRKALCAGGGNNFGTEGGGGTTLLECILLRQSTFSYVKTTANKSAEQVKNNFNHRVNRGKRRKIQFDIYLKAKTTAIFPY